MEAHQPDKAPRPPHHSGPEFPGELPQCDANRLDIAFPGPVVSTVIASLEPVPAPIIIPQLPPISPPHIATVRTAAPATVSEPVSIVAPLAAPQSLQTDNIYLPYESIDAAELIQGEGPSPRPNPFRANDEVDHMGDYRWYNIGQYELYDAAFRQVPGLNPPTWLSPPSGLQAGQVRMRTILRNLSQRAPGLGIEIEETDELPPAEAQLVLGDISRPLPPWTHPRN